MVNTFNTVLLLVNTDNTVLYLVNIFSWVDGDESEKSEWILRVESKLKERTFWVLSLLKEVLVRIPSQRLKIAEILRHDWVKNDASKRRRTDSGFEEPKQMANSDELSNSEKEATSGHRHGVETCLKLQGVPKKTPVSRFRALNPFDEIMRNL